ncbi:MAG: hypothetical protein NZM25_11570 [Leptospiraceae bacterium]|nr:hypothetical protein [Leptospiraceae bacterium]MDW8307424.1 hypothetical protein [Leptospiraceae bacterium]
MPFFISGRYWLLSLLLLCSYCASEVFQLYEIIQSPVDLQIMASQGGYEISFQSDNREEGFSGYGFFVSFEREELLKEPPNMRPPYFCPMAGGQIPFYERIRVFAGNPSQASYLCVFSDLSLMPGSHLAVRARVERIQQPWSAPAIKQVPPP